MATFLVAAVIFSFQNNFWVNLHQFLHAEAGRRAAGQALRFEPSNLSEAERAAWEEALTAYGPISKRDHVRDAGLIAVNDALSQVGRRHAAVDDRSGDCRGADACGA